MWWLFHTSAETDPGFASSVTELVRPTFRNLVLATGAIFLVWHLFVAEESLGEVSLRLIPVSITVVIVSALVLWLLPRSLLLAQVIWQMGLVAAITLALGVSQQPEVAFFYALIPGVAVVTTGWVGGFLEAGLLGVLVWSASHSRLMPPMSPALVQTVIAGGALAALFGWVGSRSMVTAIHWSLHSLAQARENMESARQHRAQAVRALKDLDLAYYRLQRTNVALLAAREVAERAERFKAELVTQVSHELRTPLNLIAGFVDVMMTSPESYGGVQIPGPYRSDLNAVYQNAQHLLALADDILDSARIEVGKIQLEKEEVDLATLVAEATEMVHDFISAKGLELQVNVQDSLPAVWACRRRIRQVLLNLLVNAARFTERGRIRVDVTLEGKEILVQVSDTGRGLRQEDLPKVFEEFRPIDEPLSSWHGGSGLGLPISKKLVELHHGRIGVESAYQRGSTFWFALPCDAATVPERARSMVHMRDRAWSREFMGPGCRRVISLFRT